MTAGNLGGAIHLDGVLDEPAWQAAGVIADLTQQSPKPGEPTPFRTEVRVVADGANLYFGITCDDPDPARIAVHTMQRDGNMTGDDTVSIVLDTFHDHRTGYLFETNAAGARLDGLISDPNAETAALDWDGIWDVHTRRTPTGWTAEFKLPAQTIRFNRSSGQWGFNVQRYVARELVTLRWTGTTLDAKLLDLRRAGNLEGIASLSQGWGLTVSPYVLGQYQIDHVLDHSFSKGQAGVDVGYHATSQLDAVLTINPDFAEVEADTRQVNLTRFDLFFPEKRPFFTDGANFFDFGLDLQEDFIPFYSRRVGLFDGRIVPITVGLKAVGRAGPVGRRRPRRPDARHHRRAGDEPRGGAVHLRPQQQPAGRSDRDQRRPERSHRQHLRRARRGLADVDFPRRQESRLRPVGSALLRGRRSRARETAGA